MNKKTYEEICNDFKIGDIVWLLRNEGTGHRIQGTIVKFHKTSIPNSVCDIRLDYLFDLDGRSIRYKENCIRRILTYSLEFISGSE